MRNDVDLPANLFEELAQVGKAFGNPNRFRLLGLLAQGERSVEALAAEAEMGLTTVSAQLQHLKAAGLVSARRAGTYIHYRLAGDDVAAAFVAVRDMAIAHSPAVGRALRGSFSAEDGPIDAVGREELLQRASANVAVLDVRPQHEFLAGHVPGAVSIPIDELEERLAEIPPEQEIVAYCRGAHCVMADDAVRIVIRNGRAASRLEGGFVEWRSEGRPLEMSA